MVKRNKVINTNDRIIELEKQLKESFRSEYKYRQKQFLLESKIKRLIPQLQKKAIEHEIIKIEKAILKKQNETLAYELDTILTSRGWKILQLLSELKETKKFWKIIKLFSIKSDNVTYQSNVEQLPESALTSIDRHIDSTREKSWHPLCAYNDNKIHFPEERLYLEAQLQPIQDGDPYCFRLRCVDEELYTISLYFGTFDRTNLNRLILKVWDESISDQPLRIADRSRVIIINNEIVKFKFKPIEHAEDKEFILSVESPGARYYDCVGIWEKRKTLSYLEWYTGKEATPNDMILIKQDIQNFSHKPLISLILPIPKGVVEHNQKTLESVKDQIYPFWELCIIIENPEDYPVINERVNAILDAANRSKIKLFGGADFLSNAAAEGCSMAQGEFVGILWNRDMLASTALFELAKLLNQHPKAEIVYTDEDEINEEGVRSHPYFKPQWSPDLLLSQMYIGSAFFFKKDLLAQCGRLQGEYPDSQKYDLALRLTEATFNIFRIPQILWHKLSSTHPHKTPYKFEKRLTELHKKVLLNALGRRRIAAKIEEDRLHGTFRVIREIQKNPRVSIIIPSGGNELVLQRCVDSILNKTSYRNYEILIVDNSHKKRSEKKLITFLESKNYAKIIPYNNPFNFSAINNYAASFSSGEHLLFLNDDTEVINSDWLEALLEHSQRADVGAVGAKLLYYDQRIQHAGIILGIGGTVGHSHKNTADHESGYFSRKDLIHNVSGVTAACLMTQKSLFQKFGGFDEKDFAVAYNDVDYNLRLRQAGFLIVYTPWARLYHHEALSRSLFDGISSRHVNETKALIQKWGHILKDDPYYNPNLSLMSEDFSLRPEYEEDILDTMIHQHLS